MGVLRINKIKITNANALVEIISKLKALINPVVRKEPVLSIYLKY